MNFDIGLTKMEAISMAMMILFAMVAMFFIGYKYAYDKAITYANEQIQLKVEEFRTQSGLGIDPDYLLGNIIPPSDYTIDGELE